jgi:hypothetical protein
MNVCVQRVCDGSAATIIRLFVRRRRHAAASCARACTLDAADCCQRGETSSSTFAGTYAAGAAVGLVCADWIRFVDGQRNAEVDLGIDSDNKHSIDKRWFALGQSVLVA